MSAPTAFPATADDASSAPAGHGLWQGTVWHGRETPAHSFRYALFMCGLDLDALTSADCGRWFAVERWGWLSFRRRDYLGGGSEPLKAAVWQKVAQLGGHATPTERVLFMGQVRTLGLYFSPVNFYFCYQGAAPRYLLAEVSNTPWRERHYYLLDLAKLTPHAKTFHVSPFMPLAMRYHWQVNLTEQALALSIASHANSAPEQAAFCATLQLTYAPLTAPVLCAALRRLPWLGGQILLGIYQQAWRLWRKGATFFGHPAREL
ncbi:MAG: DUF1365 domain-containing protein [Aeromonas sp.]